MSRINRVPSGLQDLLGSQNLGTNPADLSMVVAPTVDMFPFWAAERLTGWGQNNAAVSNSTVDIATLVVPNGEAWMPLHMAVGVTLATVGDTINTRLIVGQFPNFGPGSIGPTLATTLASSPLFTAVANATGTSLEFSWPYRVIYPAGVTFRWTRGGGDITAADAIASARLTYYRLNT